MARVAEGASVPEFERHLPYALDGFQREAIESLRGGRSVLVAAPTGSGKTVVAEYAVADALASGQRVFYTTPLKALSNQKYHDLVAQHGQASVGLLTGDNSIRGSASVVVMTTEVLRNMIYEESGSLDDLRWVVLDEIHYLQDPARGPVWEEVIVQLPDRVGLVCLSATVSNAVEVAEWIATIRGATDSVIEARRPVQLVQLYAAHDRGAHELVVAPTFDPDDTDHARPNPEIQRLVGRGGPPARGRRRRRLAVPWRIEIIDYLADLDRLPAIVFVFSRVGCDDAVEQCLDAGLSLTTDAERRHITEIADRHVAGLSEHDLEALDADWWREALRCGLAAHHAGIVPPMREAVEEAFAAGLIKVVFATETLAMGVNMPARTVVVERLTKFSGERHELLTAGEYTQLTGRAGRRGIDELGYAVVCWNPFVPFERVVSLASQPSAPLQSSFRPSYNMVANLVRRYDEEHAHRLLARSFAQYHADREISGLDRRLEHERGRLRRLRGRMADGTGDLDEYRRLVAAVDEARRSRSWDGPESLRPGDVLTTARYDRVVVVRPGAPKGRATAVTPDGELVKLGRRDLEGSQRRGHLPLSTPIRPSQAAYRRLVARQLAGADLEGPARSSAGALQDRLEALDAHPAASDPRLEDRLEAAAEADRTQKRVAKLERRLDRRSTSLVAHFDRVLGLLRSWGFVAAWELTTDGELLARIYAEHDLVVAEALRTGVFDGLEPPELAAVLSVFTFRRRGPDADNPEDPWRWPSSRVRDRVADTQRAAADLALAEHDAGLAAQAPVDPGLVNAVYRWAEGAQLGAVLDSEEISGGDFVRNVKQVVDLAVQIADLAPSDATARAASSAVRACQRGVVAASTFVS